MYEQEKRSLESRIYKLSNDVKERKDNYEEREYIEELKDLNTNLAISTDENVALQFQRDAALRKIEELEKHIVAT